MLFTAIYDLILNLFENLICEHIGSLERYDLLSHKVQGADTKCFAQYWTVAQFCEHLLHLKLTISTFLEYPMDWMRPLALPYRDYAFVRAPAIYPTEESLKPVRHRLFQSPLMIAEPDSDLGA